MTGFTRRAFCSNANLVEKLAPNTSSVESHKRNSRSSSMKVSEIVSFLDQHVIGQNVAKKAVANALRNRWRRKQLPLDLQKEIKPMNILMTGPTGVGKTEIARRLASWSDAPFVKVEATKYTEVGFHGKDVDSIIQDLVDVAVKRQKPLLESEVLPQAKLEVDSQIIDALTGKLSSPTEKDSWLEHLHAGLLDDRSITITVENSDNAELDDDPQAKFANAFFLKKEKRRMTVKQARERLLKDAVARLIPLDRIVELAIDRAEQEGIVFIDEIDKICSAAGSNRQKADASDEGVQRDLLPIIEGCEVECKKYGKVKTDHILFICAGAFNAVKPSDLLSELQGRLPVRVELNALSEADLTRILTEPKYNLLTQQQALLQTEGVNVSFPPETVAALAKAAADLNSTVANLGARRLQTVLDRVMERISFEVDEGTDVSVTAEEVHSTVSTIAGKPTDLYKSIL